MDNVAEKQSAENLKRKLNDLLFAQYIKGKNGFKDEDYGYYYAHRRLLGESDDTEVLAMVIPLVEATVNVNKALQNCFIEKNKENLNALYYAQEQLITVLNNKKNTYINAIDDATRYRIKSNIRGGLFSIVFMTLFVSLWIFVPIDVFAITFFAGLVPAILLVAFVEGHYLSKHIKNINVKTRISYTEDAFDRRNKRHCQLFKDAANEDNKKYTQIEKNKPWYDCL